MSQQLDLFATNLAPIVWRKQTAATYFMIASRAPENFEIWCVTADGHHANPEATFLDGQLITPPGDGYRALYWSSPGPVKSPVYRAVQEAKQACEVFRHLGAFPNPEED